MNIVCSAEKLKKTLEYAERLVGRHLTLPILNNIFIKTERNGIKVSSTNLELAVNSWLGCKVVKDGGITVPAKVFYSIISSLNSDKISLEVKKDNILYINSENYKASLKGESPADFPIIPRLNKGILFELDASVFTRSLSQIIGFVSNSETRPEITGVFLNKPKGENNLLIVSTDSFRLGEKVIGLDGKYNDLGFSVIVPARTISEIVRIFSSFPTPIIVNIEKNQISFESDKTELVSRLIDGHYPDYKKLIPGDFNTVAKVDKENFMKNIKLVSLLSGRISDVRLSFIKNKPCEVRFYAGDGDLGENDSVLGIDMDGEGLDIKFNWRYLLDGVAGINGNTVNLNFINEAKPCLIKSPTDKGFLYLVMPIRS